MYIYSPFSHSFPFIYSAHGTDEDFSGDENIGATEDDNNKGYISCVPMNIAAVFISFCI